MDPSSSTAVSDTLARRVRSWLQNGTILVGLAALAFWGHRTAWSFGLNAKKSNTTAPVETPLSVRFEAVGKDRRLASIPYRGLFIDVPSIEDAEQLGLEVAPVWRTKVFDRIEANGELSFEPDRTFRVSSRLSGIAIRVLKTVGDPVQRNELVAIIESVEVGRAKTELLQAVAQRNLRKQNLKAIRTGGTAVPERQQRELEAAIRESEVRVEAAKQALVNRSFIIPEDWLELPTSELLLSKLRYADIPPELISEIKSTSANLLPIRAAKTGVVLSRDIVAGEFVEAGRPFLTIVDPSRLMISLYLRNEDAASVHVGQKLTFRPDGSFKDWESVVASLSPTLDEISRTRLVRSSISNESALLRAGMLGKGTFIRQELPEALVVPPETIFTIRGVSVAFVRSPDFLKQEASKFFELRIVETGIRDGTNLEIRSGLMPGDVVVTKGGATLANRFEQYLDTAERKGVSP